MHNAALPPPSPVAPRPLRVLLSAYACEPDRGSEPGVGWNWALALLARGHQVWVITRANNRLVIEAACQRQGLPLGTQLHFIYHDLPSWALYLKKAVGLTQLYYLGWQRSVLGPARLAHQTHRFDVCHHITFGVWRQTSPLVNLGPPFVFGPVGGGEEAPWALVRTLRWRDQAYELVRHGVNIAATYLPSLRQGLKRATLVLAKTPQTAALIEASGGQSECLLEIGVHSVATLERRPQPQQTHPPFEAKLRCLYAGRLVGLKGVHLALQACAHARDAGAAVSFTIVGRGPELHRLKQLVETLNLQKQVQFIDWLSRPALDEQYQAHDVLLFPSLHDSSGNVVLESFAHGLPVVCLALGGPGTMVNDTNGIKVPAPHQASATAITHHLGQALLRLASNPALRHGLAQGALETARAMTWQAAVANVYSRFEHTAQHALAIEVAAHQEAG